MAQWLNSLGSSKPLTNPGSLDACSADSSLRPVECDFVPFQSSSFGPHPTLWAPDFDFPRSKSDHPPSKQTVQQLFERRSLSDTQTRGATPLLLDSSQDMAQNLPEIAFSEVEDGQPGSTNSSDVAHSRFWRMSSSELTEEPPRRRLSTDVPFNLRHIFRQTTDEILNYDKTRFKDIPEDNSSLPDPYYKGKSDSSDKSHYTSSSGVSSSDFEPWGNSLTSFHSYPAPDRFGGQGDPIAAGHMHGTQYAELHNHLAPWPQTQSQSHQRRRGQPHNVLPSQMHPHPHQVRNPGPPLNSGGPMQNHSHFQQQHHLHQQPHQPHQHHQLSQQQLSQQQSLQQQQQQTNLHHTPLQHPDIDYSNHHQVQPHLFRPLDSLEGDTYMSYSQDKFHVYRNASLGQPPGSTAQNIRFHGNRSIGSPSFGPFSPGSPQFNLHAPSHPGRPPSFSPLSHNYPQPMHQMALASNFRQDHQSPNYSPQPMFSSSPSMSTDPPQLLDSPNFKKRFSSFPRIPSGDVLAYGTARPRDLSDISFSSSLSNSSSAGSLVAQPTASPSPVPIKHQLHLKDFLTTLHENEKISFSECWKYFHAFVGLLPAASLSKAFLEMADVAKRAGQIDCARFCFRRALEDCPSNASGWGDWAKLEEEAGTSEQCRAVLRSALLACPSSDSLVTKAIKLEERVGQYSAARALLSRLGPIDVDKSWRALLEGALMEARVGRLGAARLVFNFLVYNVQRQHIVYHEALRLEERCGRLARAMEIAEDGIKQVSRSGPLWFSALRIAEKRGLGIESLRTILYRAHQSVTKELLWKVWYEAAQIEGRYGSIEEARVCYVKALSCCPQNLKWKIYVGGVRTELGFGKVDIARQLLDRALLAAQKKHRPSVFLECARLEEQLLCPDRAREILALACEDARHEWKIFLEAVALEFRCSRFEEGLALGTKALTLHPGTGRLWAILIQLHHVLGPEVQIEVFRRAIRAVPKSGEVWCEGARLRMNPLSPYFDLHAARRFLKFAIQFTPQYGDSFIECIRLDLLQAAPSTSLNQLVQLCVNSDPNYGVLWTYCKSHPLATPSQIMEHAITMIQEELTEFIPLYTRAMLQSHASPISSDADWVPLDSSELVTLSFDRSSCGACRMRFDAGSFRPFVHLNCPHSFHTDCLEPYSPSFESTMQSSLNIDTSCCPLCSEPLCILTEVSAPPVPLIPRALSNPTRQGSDGSQPLAHIFPPSRHVSSNSDYSSATQSTSLLSNSTRLSGPLVRGPEQQSFSRSPFGSGSDAPSFLLEDPPFGAENFLSVPFFDAWRHPLDVLSSSDSHAESNRPHSEIEALFVESGEELLSLFASSTTCDSESDSDLDDLQDEEGEIESLPHALDVLKLTEEDPELLTTQKNTKSLFPSVDPGLVSRQSSQSTIQVLTKSNSQASLNPSSETAVPAPWDHRQEALGRLRVLSNVTERSEPDNYISLSSPHHSQPSTVFSSPLISLKGWYSHPLFEPLDFVTGSIRLNREYRHLDRLTPQSRLNLLFSSDYIVP